MKLLVPCIGQLHPVDRRLAGLASFLGIAWEAIPLPKAEFSTNCLEKAATDPQSCLVVHPRVMEEWVDEDHLPAELVSLLLSRFRYLLVHAPRPEPFDANLIAALSCGYLRSVEEIGHQGSSYAVSANAQDVCGVFAGLTFGMANPVNDRVFSVGPASSAARELISLGGLPFMTEVAWEKTKVLFLAGQDVAELNAEVGDNPFTEYFSRLLPHSMALRYIFGEESWHPCKQHASVIIDDPPLWRNYGFLNFGSLLSLVEQHRFHASIAFIPHNFRRTSAAIARSVLEHSDRLSICFHGNDHTGAEFASTDPALLNTMLQIAEQRMSIHRRLTGLDCDRVMVFPQGKFSTEAMAVLKTRNFDAAVNTVPYPVQQTVRLSLAELAQPAVLRYAGFPLFLREDSVHTQVPEIAFKLFFGRPIFIVEHHHIFKRPEALVAAVSRVNASAPQVRWSSPAYAISNSLLWRRAPDGVFNVRAYSRTIRLSNDSGSQARLRIEWNGYDGGAALPRQLLRDGTPCAGLEASDHATAATVDLQPGRSHTFAFVHGSGNTTRTTLGFRRTIDGFVRRRLSEVRDNYLSKNPALLTAAEALKRHLVR
ncbi:MAG TPA: hypothetical protein VE957_12330 [Terriglobales bacterium]|nr:hypothetical protein [Terriglobales bacterium]